MLAIIIFLLQWLILYLLKYRIGYIHAVFAFISFQSIAVYNLGVDTKNIYPFIIFVSGNFAILFGLFIGSQLFRRRTTILPTRPISKKMRGKVVFFVSSVALMVAYHYAVGGIPLLSSNVVIERFNNTSSGLFGLPGRFNLFGTFFAFFLASMSYFYSRAMLSRSTFLFSGLLLFASLALAGNKGNVIQFIVAIMVLLPYSYTNSDLVQLRNKIKARYFILASGGSVAFFIAISMIHINAGDATYSNVFEALEKRIMEVSGKAFYVAATSVINTEGVGWGSYFTNDISNFLGNFLGSGFAEFSTIELVSSYVTGRDINSGLFLVPVTITSHGYAMLEFGAPGPCIVGIPLGIFMSWLYFYPFRNLNITNSAISLFFQVMTFWIITKGSVGYYLPNMLIMAVIFYLFLCIYNAYYEIARGNLWKA